MEDLSPSNSAFQIIFKKNYKKQSSGAVKVSNLILLLSANTDDVTWLELGGQDEHYNALETQRWVCFSLDCTWNSKVTQRKPTLQFQGFKFSLEKS